jgi:hypothetical protein
MTYHNFADALLARGLSVFGLREPVAVDPSADLPMPHRNTGSANPAANSRYTKQSARSANPTAWHVLLNTH